VPPVLGPALPAERWRSLAPLASTGVLASAGPALCPVLGSTGQYCQHCQIMPKQRITKKGAPQISGGGLFFSSIESAEDLVSKRKKGTVPRSGFSLAPSTFLSSAYDETRFYGANASSTASDRLEAGTREVDDLDDEAACLRDDYVPVHLRTKGSSSGSGGGVGGGECHGSGKKVTGSARSGLFGSGMNGSSSSASASAFSSSSSSASNSGRSATSGVLDLSAVTAEITNASKSLSASSDASAWDFSGISSADSRKGGGSAAAAGSPLQGGLPSVANFVRSVAATDAVELKDRMRVSVDISHKKRVKGLQGAQRAADFAEKLSSKAAAISAKRRNWNRSKGI
jgi:hypothetical protein